MPTLPSALQAALAEALGSEPRRTVLMGGGMINQAARVDLPAGAVFVKWKEDAPPGFFAAEADGLERLRAARALRVPQVLAFHDRKAAPAPSGAQSREGGSAILSAPDAFEPARPSNRPDPLSPPFLALEYIAQQLPQDEAQFARRFGEALAALHHDNLSPSGAFGLEKANFLGVLAQPNTPHARWPEFYRDCRLLPQVAFAREKGLLPPALERRLLEVVERLDSLMEGLSARPVLLHGDLWSGNFLAAGEEPVVIDPAVYYGEREIEIAFMELFGGFPPGLLPAYRAAFPLDAGYARRRSLHQIFPLLIHVNHFGAAYIPPLDAALSQIA